MQTGAINHPTGPPRVRTLLSAKDTCCLTESVRASTWKQAIGIQLNFKMEPGEMLGFVPIIKSSVMVPPNRSAKWTLKENA